MNARSSTITSAQRLVRGCAVSVYKIAKFFDEFEKVTFRVGENPFKIMIFWQNIKQFL